MNVKEVKKRYTDALMALPNVTGLGIGEKGGSSVIKVFVVRKVPLETLSASERVPEELEGVPCAVEEMGVVNAQPAEGAEGSDKPLKKATS